MKQCGMCIKELPDEDFAFKNKATGRRQSHCRTCQKSYRRQHYDDNKRKYVIKAQAWTASMVATNRVQVLQYLNEHPCVDCGEADPEVLEFDHRESAEKTFGIGAAIWTKSWRFIEREIVKCDVRCANCHRRRTNRQFGYWRSTATLV